MNYESSCCIPHLFPSRLCRRFFCECLVTIGLRFLPPIGALCFRVGNRGVVFPFKRMPLGHAGRSEGASIFFRCEATLWKQQITPTWNQTCCWLTRFLFCSSHAASSRSHRSRLKMMAPPQTLFRFPLSDSLPRRDIFLPHPQPPFSTILFGNC